MIDEKKILIRNLSPDTDEASLRAAFEGFGSIVEVKVNSSKREGYVTFSREKDANLARIKMNLKEFHGSKIQVRFYMETEGDGLRKREFNYESLGGERESNMSIELGYNKGKTQAGQNFGKTRAITDLS